MDIAFKLTTVMGEKCENKKAKEKRKISFPFCMLSEDFHFAV